MKILVRLAAAILFAQSAWGAVSPQEAARLGQDLTPLGGEKAGNADGTIPAWTGGIKSAAEAGFPNYRSGDHHPDPFASDKPLFTITAANLSQYAARLTEGHKALFKAYPDYKLIVYPTHRSAASPEHVYEATKRNATTGKLVPDGNGITGALGGVPFPIPQSGVEIYWNHVTRWRGLAAALDVGQAPLTASGSYTLVNFKEEFYFQYYEPGMDEAKMNNILLYFTQETTAPARLAGEILLVQETLDQAKEPRRAWVYNPGQRRVRRAPNVAFDNPGTNADNLRTADQFDMYTAVRSATTGRSSARRKCTSRTTPIACRTRRSATARCCTGIISTRTSRDTSCTAYGSWTRGSRRARATSTAAVPCTWTRTRGRSSRSTATTRAGSSTGSRRGTP
jgi:hypothetical protein